MKIEISFHGPFRIETGDAHDGVAATVNRDDLIPAASLKGLMRASATQLLPNASGLIAEIFGGKSASPWHWGPVTFDQPPTFGRRVRIAVDAATGTVHPKFFALGEEVWASKGVFHLTCHQPLPAETRRRHETVLACAAAGVHALGADRRRGHGWVTLRPSQPLVDDALLAAFEDIVAECSTTSEGGPRA